MLHATAPDEPLLARDVIAPPLVPFDGHMPVERVAIIGAGIGGLASALVLHRLGREVVILERDAEPSRGGEPDPPHDERRDRRRHHAQLTPEQVEAQKRFTEVRGRAVGGGVSGTGSGRSQPSNQRAELHGSMPSVAPVCLRQLAST